MTSETEWHPDRRHTSATAMWFRNDIYFVQICYRHISGKIYCTMHPVVVAASV